MKVTKTRGGLIKGNKQRRVNPSGVDPLAQSHSFLDGSVCLLVVVHVRVT
jgi:hypothetical protein